MTTPTLFGLTVSPWTEKARWALDHHAVGYHYREHLPMLGEPALRWRTRGRPIGSRPTVPLLIDGGARIGDSNAIARHVERRGHGEPLLLAGHEAEIESWERDAETAMQAARVLLARALVASPGAQLEMLPPIIPGPLRRPLRPLAWVGASFIASKYDANTSQATASLASLRRFAKRIRDGLDGHAYLVGERFSWADISATMVINGFAGGVPGRLKRWPLSVETWTRSELVAEFGELIDYRDRLYQDHRPASARLR